MKSRVHTLQLLTVGELAVTMGELRSLGLFCSSLPNSFKGEHFCMGCIIFTRNCNMLYKAMCLLYGMLQQLHLHGLCVRRVLCTYWMCSHSILLDASTALSHHMDFMNVITVRYTAGTISIRSGHLHAFRLVTCDLEQNASASHRWYPQRHQPQHAKVLLKDTAYGCRHKSRRAACMPVTEQLCHRSLYRERSVDTW